MTSSSPFVHFANQGATNTGAVLDLGGGISSFTTQIVSNTGVTAGAVTVLGSIDGVTYTPITNSVLAGKSASTGTLAAGVLTFTGAGSFLVSSANAGNAIRFIRADVTTTMVGGTASATSIGLGK